MDVFISWTSRDRDVKNVLAEKLQAAGISCWDSEEYCTSDYSQECINAIKRCGVFIVIVSDASMETGYVKNEIIAARKQEEAGLLNMLVYKITDAPYTDDFEFQLNHISFVTGNLFQRQESLRGESAIDVLVTRTQRLLKLRREGQPEKPFRVKLPRVEGWQLTGDTGYFVDNSRDDIIRAMEAAFQKGNVVVLTEFIGFGKRSVIRKYLSLHPGQFSSAVMVDNQWGSLRNFLQSGLRFSNLNPATFDGLEGDALIDAKLRQLEKLDSGMLLVIPDCTLPEDRELYRRLLSLRCPMILLTQGSAESCYDLLPVIRVGKMEDTYLTELFFHHYTRAFDEEKEQLQSILEDFFDQIGGHTKTVELTASVLNRDMGIMPTQVGAFLSLQGTEGMELKDRIFSQLSQMFVIEKLTPVQVKALVIAACLAVPYLSEQNFRQLLGDFSQEEWQQILELDSRRWLDMDLKNRTVSMEPLVAQIVLRRFPEEQELLLQCFQYLENSYTRQYAVSDSRGFISANMSRMEHFFRLTGLEAIAELTEVLKESLLGGGDKEGLKAAMEGFRREYPEADFSADPGDWEFSDQRELFVYCVQYFVRTTLMPLVKIQASEAQSIWMDFSGGNNRIWELFSDRSGDFSLDFDSLIGMDREEFRQWLETMRASVAQMEAGGEEEFLHFMAEAMSVCDAMFRRDRRGMLLGMENLLLHLEESEELLADGDLADMFFSCVVMLNNVYLHSKAFQAAVRLCEKALSYSAVSFYQVMLRKQYITALAATEQFDGSMYAQYELLLRELEEYGTRTFENRQELLREKQKWELDYAVALAMGEECDRARQQFQKACKPGCLLPNEWVHTAWTVAEGLIRSGEFEQAKVFLEQHVGSRECLSEQCDEAHQNTLSKIQDLLALDAQTQNDFEADADPERHTSYYHAYSRKNNSLLDRKYCAVAEKALEFDFEELSDRQIGEYAKKLRMRSSRENLLRLAPEAFALASEAGFRVLGYRHHYVQYMGAAAMADGKIAEILNGEGKTYTIVAVAFLQWIFGKQVFVVDESPYLTQRNHSWMQGVYSLLGMESFHVKSFRELEDAKADVYYITLREMMFAYLSHELDISSTRSGLKLDVAIIDEIDTVLVDEAKQWFHIVTGEEDPLALPLHQRAWKLAESLDIYGEDFKVQGYEVTLLPDIYPKMEQLFGVSWDDLERVNLLQRIENLVRIAILCRFVYEENKDYFLHKGVPVVEDRMRGVFTPLQPSYTYFLSELNGLDMRQIRGTLQYRSRVRNAICVRDLFRKFRTVCGTTATAVSFRKEFREIYDLEYVAIPPHSPVIRVDTQSPLYVSARAKDRAILEMVAQKQELGQPVLLITQSIAESEKYHKLLKRAGIEHRLLNAKNAEEAANILATAGMPGSVLVANALVSRGADIRLGGSPERQTLRTLVEMGTDISGLEDFLYRLPTPEQKESELYKKYHSILEQNKRLTARQRQAVVEAGGLCVIGTSFFTEPRNEQQTRGRCGRQGEVGESRVFQSMDDPGLKELLSNAYMEMVMSTVGDMEELDGAFLMSALKKAQQRLHESNFAHIRSINASAQSLEKHRKDFIGLRMDLTEGLVEVDEVLEQWAADPAIHKQLQLLQQGQSRCESMALNHLWKQDDSLQNAKGLRVRKLLQEAFRKELSCRFSSLTEEEREKVFTQCLCKQLQQEWENYIEIAMDAVKALKSGSLEKFLEQEKDRLLRRAIEKLLLLRMQ